MRRTADVVIVGGGCMGASTAYHLARRGVTNVVLVEREPFLATGSTGRNAGGVRHQFSQEVNIRLSIESIAAFERFGDELGVEIDLHQDGYLFLLSTTDHVEAFRRNVTCQQGLGVPVEWLSADDARRLAPGLATEGVMAATFCGRDGVADPNGVTLGYAKAARSLGVEVVCDAEAVGVRKARDRVAGIETTRGPIDAPIVVNAAGPWAQRLGEMAGLDIPIEPLRRHIFLAQPAGGGSWDDECHRGRVPSTRILVIDFESTFYFHREVSRVLFGMGDPAERSGFDMTVRWDFLPEVIEVAMRRLPALADAEVSHAWAGLYEMTPDGMPVIGPVESLIGYHVIAGFSGHGFQHSPAAGRVLADVITGRDPGLDLAPFRLERFTLGRGAPERNVV